MSCKNTDCDAYPVYGIAPHQHLELTDPPSFVKSTRLRPREEWPKNFIEDKEEPGHGTYYCPECFEETK